MSKPDKKIKVNIKPVGVISVLDIDKKEIPLELEAWLNASSIIWIDTVAEEHILNPYTELDIPANTPQYIEEAIKDALEQLKNLCEDFNCQYVRLRTS